MTKPWLEKRNADNLTMFRCRSQRLINRSYSSLIFAPTVDSVLFKSVTYSDIMQQLIHRLLRIVNVLPFFGHCHWHPHRVTAVKHTIACGSYPNHPIRLAPPRAYAPQKTIKREPQNLEPPGKTLNSFEESSYSFIFRFHLCVFLDVFGESNPVAVAKSRGKQLASYHPQ